MTTLLQHFYTVMTPRVTRVGLETPVIESAASALAASLQHNSSGRPRRFNGRRFV
jgi:hypothetical protein